MLNYKELKSEFSKILSSFSASDLQEWIEFDNQREELERLTNGERVVMCFNDFSVSRLYDLKENIITVQNTYQYAIAA